MRGSASTIGEIATDWPVAATLAAPAAVPRAWSTQSDESGIQASGLTGVVITPWPESELATCAGSACVTLTCTQ